MNKNFLQKVANVSDGPSKNVWDALKKAGYIDKEGYLTKKYTPNTPGFTLKLPQKCLGKKLNIEIVSSTLCGLFNKNSVNQVDLWELLYKQAWDYLERNNQHSTAIEKTETEKKALFGQFLASFKFKIKQSDILETETKILNNLSEITNQQPTQVFLCLAYAIREWFRHEYKQNLVPILTKEIMNNLLQEALIRSHDMILLQGRTEAVLSNIHHQYKGRQVPRNEIDTLQKELL